MKSALQNDRTLDFLHFCYYEIGNKCYPQALIESYAKIIDADRCHIARHDDSAQLDHLVEYGDDSICALDETYKNQDPLRKEESYLRPNTIINLNLQQKQLAELATTIPLIEMSIKQFSLTDYMATIHPENYGLICFRYGKAELSAEERLIHETISPIVLQCYVLHRKLNRFENLWDIGWQLNKQSNKNPSAVITHKGEILYNDPRFLHLLNKFHLSMRRLIHFVKGMFDQKHMYSNSLNSEYLLPVYHENEKQLSVKIEPVRINESVFYLVSIISILKSDNITITRREFEIVSYIKQGCTNREIASILCISEETVKRHISNMFMKTGARNRIQLINRINSLREIY